MASTLRFDDEQSGTHRLVGGKGANLGLLARAGFPVPPGFSVTTDAYTEFLRAGNLEEKIEGLAGDIHYDDPDQLESVTSEIRDLIVRADLPRGLASEIEAAYGELGASPYVAVRSSGTAEDLAEASFAGLHDTYLDIKGTAALLDAVKRCWGSMWTARATAYRNNKGFDHMQSRIAVVVQTMVEADVAGVMFTGNPMTGATDEIVINASWGLGEAVVSGVATPDEYVLRTTTLQVRDKTLGTKTVKIVRNSETGNGTVTQDVPAAQQATFTLSDSQAAQLGELGRRVTAYYGGIPQDIEWALANGTFHLLQSRPVTGADFSWDADVDGWQPLSEDEDTVWTRSWADEIWTGAITPLMYSVRARCFTGAHMYSQKLWGLHDNAARRMWKYYKGAAYFNCTVDKTTLERVIWPQFRPAMAANLPPEWRDDVVKAPFSLATYLRMQARIMGMDPVHGVYKWLSVMEDYMYNRIEEANGPTNEAFGLMSDEELKRTIDRFVKLEEQYITDVWTGFFIQASQVVSLLGLIVAKWYDGDNPLAFTDLITGAPKRTITQEENVHLWHMSKKIRESAELSKLFETHQNGDFFARLENSDQGRELLSDYRAFIAQHGHRGHADRDIYYTRRAEDPAVDYRALQALLTTAADHDPEQLEDKVNQRREAVVEEVVENMRRKPLGTLRVELFRVLLSYTHRFLMDRDNERHWIDRTTFTMKRGFLEVGGRLVDRQLLDDVDQVFFLTKEEAYDLLDGRGNQPLAKAKIAGRKRNFELFHTKAQIPPLYLHRGRPAELDAAGEEAGDGSLRGIGTSRGTVTGTARIVRELKDIGRVRNREILVTNSTDPGWTPVFLVISGIVLETGGMLAHGSCLAREYGFPAVQVANAISRIPDGATITINGDTGEVTIVDNATAQTELAETAAQ